MVKSRTYLCKHKRFNSVLYYNAVVWLVPEIGLVMKQMLLSISACALRSCIGNVDNVISFEKLYQINKKCTPTQIMAYQSALQLHKILDFNNLDFVQPSFESVTVLNQMAVTSRQINFIIFRENTTKIGMNTTAYKFNQLSGKMSLNSLGYSFVHYKKLMKFQFLKYGKT